MTLDHTLADSNNSGEHTLLISYTLGLTTYLQYVFGSESQVKYINNHGLVSIFEYILIVFYHFFKDLVNTNVGKTIRYLFYANRCVESVDLSGNKLYCTATYSKQT